MKVSLTECGKWAEKTVNTVEDFPGKPLGVQLGTTGDILASIMEERGSTIEVLIKGKETVKS